MWSLSWMLLKNLMARRNLSFLELILDLAYFTSSLPIHNILKYLFSQLIFSFSFNKDAVKKERPYCYYSQLLLYL